MFMSTNTLKMSSQELMYTAACVKNFRVFSCFDSELEASTQVTVIICIYKFGRQK